jgi:hypothetical protein
MVAPRVLIGMAILIPVLTAVTVALVQQKSGKHSVSVDTSNWRTYRDDQNSFELKYPADWQLGSSSGSGPRMITIRQPGDHNLAFTFTVQKDQNPAKLPIEEWFANELKKMGSKPESQGRTTVGEWPAIYMDNTNKFGKRRSVFVSLHQTDVLTFIYEPGENFDSTYEAILGSFRPL